MFKSFLEFQSENLEAGRWRFTSNLSMNKLTTGMMFIGQSRDHSMSILLTILTIFLSLFQTQILISRMDYHFHFMLACHLLHWNQTSIFPHCPLKRRWRMPGIRFFVLLITPSKVLGLLVLELIFHGWKVSPWLFFSISRGTLYTNFQRPKEEIRLRIWRTNQFVI